MSFIAISTARLLFFRQRRQNRFGLQRFGRPADLMFEIRPADRELAFGVDQIGLRAGQTGLRLGHVGSGQFADSELFLRRVALLLQDRDIVLAKLHGRLVAHDVHIGRNRGEQDDLFRGDRIARARLSPAIWLC